MKKVLTGLLVLGSFSSFAQVSTYESLEFLSSISDKFENSSTLKNIVTNVEKDNTVKCLKGKTNATRGYGTNFTTYKTECVGKEKNLKIRVKSKFNVEVYMDLSSVTYKLKKVIINH